MVAGLRRRVVGTGGRVGSQLLPVAVIGSGEDYAESAWFQSDNPGKRVCESEGKGFLCRSVYESGFMSHLLVTSWQVVGLNSTCSDFGFLKTHEGADRLLAGVSSYSP